MFSKGFTVFLRYQKRLRARAASLLLTLEGRLDRIMQMWLLFAGLACGARIGFSTMSAPADAATIAPYFMVILAPFASMVLALRWFANGDRQPQPQMRFARLSKWRAVDRLEAMRQPLFGAGGIMVSLLVGMLLNVPVRVAEYLVAMPALAGPVPSWLSTLHVLMTLDVVIFTSLYTIAFVAALRRVPLFPRLLGTIWICDVAMQMLTAQLVSHAPGLPQPVGVALHGLLDGNVKKVLISVALWLPYLLLSKRVNVTFRHRVPA